MTPYTMELTPAQRDMLNGSDGSLLARCLETLVVYGEGCGARRLVPARSAHLAGTFRISVYKTYYDIVHQLALAGLQVRIPTTLNPRPGRTEALLNRVIFRGQESLEEDYAKLGITPNYSCVSYMGTDAPKKGDILAWAESSAVVYANSVLGARTNRNAILIDLCSAMTGWTPEFGLLLDENRKAGLWVRLDIERMDPAALGYIIGRIAVDRVPVLDRFPFDPVALKNMGAAMASTGAVALFHVQGLTPEAPDLEAVLPDTPVDEVTITQDDLDALADSAPAGHDRIVVGCPQMTIDEALQVGARLAKSEQARKTQMHLMPEAVAPFLASEAGKACLAAGIRVSDSCPLGALGPGAGLTSARKLTTSGKLAFYLENTDYATLEQICGTKP